MKLQINKEKVNINIIKRKLTKRILLLREQVKVIVAKKREITKKQIINKI